jgi:hypothetical protein
MYNIDKLGYYSDKDKVEAKREVKRRANYPKVKAKMLKQEKEIYHTFLEFYPEFKLREALRLARESLKEYRYCNLYLCEMIVRTHWELDGNKLKDLYAE